MNTFLQDLCRPLNPLLQAGRWGVVCGLAASGFAVAQAPPAPSLPQQAQHWLAEQHAVKPELIAMRPMDQRIQVPTCVGAWAFDAPFPGQNSVRAVCDSPKTQVFLQWTSQRVKLTLPVPPRAAPTEIAAPRQALAASRTLPRGSHLDATMVQWVDVPANQWSAHHLNDEGVVQGSQLMRDMLPGQVIRRQDIRPSVLVKKGQMVSFQVGQSSSFTINATVQALQDGRMGEQIRLKNPDSGRILSGVVTGLNTVQTP